MTTISKLVPVALLNDIEATWREASAFSNTANNLIERRLPELRALLATPMPQAAQPDPIIGVLKSNLANGVMPSFSGGDLKHLIKLLEAPHAELAALREALERARDKWTGMAALAGEACEKHDAISTLLTAAEQRNAELTGLLQRVVDSSVLSFEQDAPEELESLEVDICAAIKPTESGASE